MPGLTGRAGTVNVQEGDVPGAVQVVMNPNIALLVILLHVLTESSPHTFDDIHS